MPMGAGISLCDNVYDMMCTFNVRKTLGLFGYADVTDSVGEGALLLMCIQLV